MSQWNVYVLHRLVARGFTVLIILVSISEEQQQERQQHICDLLWQKSQGKSEQLSKPSFNHL